MKKLSELLNRIDIIKIDGKQDKKLSCLTIDSRKAKSDSLYFAIKGFQLDGHKFINSAIKNGASVIVYEDETYNFYNENKNVTFILVKDIRKVEAIIAHDFYDNPTTKMTIIGITGTNGKTSTTYILDSIFQYSGINSGVIGTIGYKINDKITTLNNTTPDAIELVSILDKMQKEGVQNVVMEVSSHALILYRSWGIQFDLVLWSNLTQDHLDFHKDMEDYYQAKKLLFTSYLNNSEKRNRKILINIDDNYGKRLVSEFKNFETNVAKDDNLVGIFTSSIKKVENIKGDEIIKSVIRPNMVPNNFNKKIEEQIKVDFRIKDYHLSLDGVLFSLKNNNKEFMFKSSLVGEYNIYNILAAISSALLLDISIDDISLAINKMNQIPGRLENCNIKNRNIFIDYAHTPDAVESVLKTLKPIVEGKLYAIVGAGGDRDKTKRPLMSLAAIKYCDKLILTSDNPRTENPEMILNDLEKPLLNLKIPYVREVDRKFAIESTLKLLKENDALVICGKGHEDYQIIGKEKFHFSDMEVVKDYFK